MNTRVFRTHPQKIGGHVHVRVFSAPAPHLTYASIGVLVMDDDDYREFVKAFKAEHIEGGK